MMTVKDLWETTTCDVVIYGEGNPLRTVKLLSGGRLQVEHAEMIVKKIDIVKQSMEPCYLKVCVKV